MPKLQFYTITFFFLLSGVFAGSISPSCSKHGYHHHHHHNNNKTAGTVELSSATRPSNSTARPASATHRNLTASTTPSHPVTQPTSSPADASDPGASPTDIQAWLTGHNTLRAKHGAMPLTWNDTVAEYAEHWAERCLFQHSDGPYGENLAVGNPFTIPQVCEFWASEEAQYDPRDPVYSHYTQMVWKSTTQLGCARRLCGGIIADVDAYLFVCSYNPPGNYIGEFSQNVQP